MASSTYQKGTKKNFANVVEYIMLIIIIELVASVNNIIFLNIQMCNLKLLLWIEMFYFRFFVYKRNQVNFA